VSWRTVVVHSRCKLDLKLGYMVMRGEETKRVFIDEIAILIIESTAVSLTGCLLAALSERKVRVIFCDSKRNPFAEMSPYTGAHDSSRKIRMQMNWKDSTKELVWTSIVREKIAKQAELLSECGFIRETEMLKRYIEEMEAGDSTNREGHAAKVYFNALFGLDFTRRSECTTNAALDYGYGLILSAFNREAAANGYLSQLGLHHDNAFNPYNLSSDLMEPYRILIDRTVRECGFTEFSTAEKHRLVAVLYSTVTIGAAKQNVMNAIRLYVKSVFDALNDDTVSDIRWYRL